MKTVKVRIAVAVDGDGGYNSAGWRESGKEPPKDCDVMGLACDAVADGEARYWLEAELRVPEPKVVKSMVEIA